MTLFRRENQAFWCGVALPGDVALFSTLFAGSPSIGTSEFMRLVALIEALEATFLDNLLDLAATKKWNKLVGYFLLTYAYLSFLVKISLKRNQTNCLIFLPSHSAILA